MFYTWYFHMKKLFMLTGLLLGMIILSWCDQSHNFMDVDNPNAKEDLINLIWTWNIPQINTDNIIPESLSWTREDVKWYANKYYEESLEEYVNIAREWISWAKDAVKWYYNDWIDDLNQMIRDKVNWAISGELNKFKIK